MSGETPRKTPCASCPYRQGTPSGVWHPEEYAKLPEYDGDGAEQRSFVPFSCHQPGEHVVCAGWLGHREHPTDLMAVRLGLMSGQLDPSCASYETTVPLFASGQEAAAHGMQDIEAPSDEALEVQRKIGHLRNLS